MCMTRFQFSKIIFLDLIIFYFWITLIFNLLFAFFYKSAPRCIQLFNTKFFDKIFKIIFNIIFIIISLYFIILHFFCHSFIYQNLCFLLHFIFTKRCLKNVQGPIVTVFLISFLFYKMLIRSNKLNFIF